MPMGQATTRRGDERQAGTEGADVEFDARGWRLHGTLFEGRGNGPAILVSSAAMVPQGYYAPFARHLIAQGASAVLTYDYRGVADSAGDRRRWPELAMKDWAVLDMPAAARFLLERSGRSSLVGMGHSYGGQALGLSGVSDLFERYATVATMSGNWRLLDTPWRIFAFTQMLGRATAHTLGRIPKFISPGEEMPGSIFLDWARWIHARDYWFGDPSVPETSRFAQVRTPYLSIRPQDDVWATERAVDAFMRHYTGNDLRHLVVRPGKTGPLGHLGFFRRRHADTHWPDVTRFLLEGIWPAAAVPQDVTRVPPS